MSTIFDKAVIAGYGQLSETQGGIMLYVSSNELAAKNIEGIRAELEQLTASSDPAPDKALRQLNFKSTLLMGARVATIGLAELHSVRKEGYAAIMLHVDWQKLSAFPKPNLLQNELMLPYVNIDQDDRMTAIWFDDYAGQLIPIVGREIAPTIQIVS